VRRPSAPALGVSNVSYNQDMKTKLIFGCLLILFVIPASAQTRKPEETGKPDTCQVAFVDYSSKKAQSSDLMPAHKLGRFQTVTAEEVETTRAYRIPGTKLFVIASVFYTDESMVVDNSQDSMTLEISISRTPKRDILSSLRFADAEVMLQDPRVSRVSTLFKVNGRILNFIMECRDDVEGTK
jgi:hypothetical protein